jgi:hypothetical protein
MKINFLLIVLPFMFFSCNGQEKKAPELTPEIDFLRLGVPDSLKYLLPILDSVLKRDQKYRKGNNPDTLLRYSKEIRYIDSINLVIVEPIIKRYGILGFNDIGSIGYFALVKPIQHADLTTQERYLPTFREAIEKRKILPETYAMLEDRVAIRNGRMQIYGTQVMTLTNGKAELLPTIDIDNVDYRRKTIRMAETLEFYLSRFKIKWDIRKYKEKLPELKAKYKIK